MVKKEFITVPLKDIIPYEKNPRRNDEAAVDVAKSIQEIENLDPIEVDEDNVILSGHTRLKALKKLGYTETEVIRFTGLTEQKKKAYRILANKTQEKAEWDLDLLNLELDDITDIDMSGFGFELSDGGVDQYEVSEDDYDEDPPEEPKAKVGDLYRLGDHYLICGDCTDESVIKRLLDDAKADLLLTDPPYGISVVSNGGGYNRHGQLAESGGGPLHFKTRKSRRRRTAPLQDE